jgi:hypothetical protein
LTGLPATVRLYVDPPTYRVHYSADGRFLVVVTCRLVGGGQDGDDRWRLRAWQVAGRRWVLLDERVVIGQLCFD